MIDVMISRPGSDTLLVSRVACAKERKVRIVTEFEMSGREKMPHMRCKS